MQNILYYGEDPKPKVVHITLPCQPAEKAAAVFKNESKFDAQFNLQGIFYFVPEKSNNVTVPHEGEEGNRLSLCKILYILWISSSMAFQIIMLKTTQCHVARCGAVY